MKELGTRVLLTKRLTLRKVHLEDALMLYEQLGKDASLWQYMAYNPLDTLAHAKEYVADIMSHYGDPYYFFWVVMLKDEIIGFVEAINNQLFISSNEIGFMVDSKHQGNGSMREALTRVLSFLLDDVGYHKITACTLEVNVSCITLLERIGMKREGTLHDEMIINDQYQNVVLYAYLKEDENKLSVV